MITFSPTYLFIWKKINFCGSLCTDQNVKISPPHPPSILWIHHITIHLMGVHHILTMHDPLSRTSICHSRPALCSSHHSRLHTQAKPLPYVTSRMITRSHTVFVWQCLWVGHILFRTVVLCIGWNMAVCTYVGWQNAHTCSKNVFLQNVQCE